MVNITDRRPITHGEFEVLITLIDVKSVRETSDHQHTFYGTLAGVPVLMRYDFAEAAGYLRTQASDST